MSRKSASVYVVDDLRDNSFRSRFFEMGIAEGRIAPRALPTKLAAKFISKTPNALRIMKCRGLIDEVGQIGKEKYYSIHDLERLRLKRR